MRSLATTVKWGSTMLAISYSMAWPMSREAPRSSKPCFLHQPALQLGGGMLQGLEKRACASQNHDGVIGFQARPGDLLILDEVYGKLHIHGDLHGVFLLLPVPLPGVAVAHEQKGTRFEDRQHQGRSGNGLVVVHVSAELTRRGGGDRLLRGRGPPLHSPAWGERAPGSPTGGFR